MAAVHAARRGIPDKKHPLALGQGALSARMDTILRPTAPSAWEIISTEGAVLGALERRPEGFVIAPSISTLLAEDQTIPNYCNNRG